METQSIVFLLEEERWLSEGGCTLCEDEWLHVDIAQINEIDGVGACNYHNWDVFKAWQELNVAHGDGQIVFGRVVNVERLSILVLTRALPVVKEKQRL